MEAFGSTHYWSRCSHKVKAIAESSQRHNMRFVLLKSLEQENIQIVHRIRERLVHNRAALINQIRGLLAEYGLVTPKGMAHLKKNLPIFLEDAENELSTFTRRYFLNLKEELDELRQKITLLDKEITRLSKRQYLIILLMEPL